MPIVPELIRSWHFLRRKITTGSPAWWTRLDQENRKWIVGLLLIFAVTVIWVLASFVVQEVEKHGLDPFLLTYIANSLFVVYLPLYFCISRAKAAVSPPQRVDTEDNNEGETEAARLQGGGPLSSDPELEGLPNTIKPPAQAATSQLRIWRPFQDPLLAASFKAAVVVAPLWFCAQYFFNVSLHLTSVTSNTILSSTASLFTYALACAFSLEQLAVRKLLFISLCMADVGVVYAGVGLVGFVDEHSDPGKSGKNTFTGDLLCILSACFYAAYTVAIRLLLGDESKTSTMLFFGLVGVINLVVLGIVLVILAALAVVDVGQLTGRLLGLVIGKGLFDNALSDYLWARAVLLIGPTVASLGLSLQLPMAAGADVVVNEPQWLRNGAWPLMLLGASLIMAGFFGINVENWGCGGRTGE